MNLPLSGRLWAAFFVPFHRISHFVFLKSMLYYILYERGFLPPKQKKM